MIHADEGESGVHGARNSRAASTMEISSTRRIGVSMWVDPLAAQQRVIDVLNLPAQLGISSVTFKGIEGDDAESLLSCAIQKKLIMTTQIREYFLSPPWLLNP
jgi:hypothetical protein